MYSLFVFATGFVTGYVSRNGVKHSAKLVYSAARALGAGAERVFEEIEDAKAEVDQQHQAAAVAEPAK